MPRAPTTFSLRARPQLFYCSLSVSSIFTLSALISATVANFFLRRTGGIPDQPFLRVAEDEVLNAPSLRWTLEASRGLSSCPSFVLLRAPLIGRSAPPSQPLLTHSGAGNLLSIASPDAFTIRTSEVFLRGEGESVSYSAPASEGRHEEARSLCGCKRNQVPPKASSTSLDLDSHLHTNPGWPGDRDKCFSPERLKHFHTNCRCCY